MNFSPYMLGIYLEHKSVVVFGGGTVATRKITQLYNAGAHITVISPTITPTISGLKGERLTHCEREYSYGDCAHSWLVVAATADREVNAKIIDECSASQIWAIRVDHGSAGSAITPAQAQIHDKKIAVVTGNPRYSVELKNFLLQQIVQYSSHQHRVMHDTDAHTVSQLAGTVALIGAGPGAADLITVRGERLLACAQVIVADRLGSQELLTQLSPEALVIDVGKNPYKHTTKQADINRMLVSYAREGKFVVRLKGGDPYIFGRGFEEVLYLRQAGIRVEVVPGLSSAIAVPTLASIPLSFRGINHDILIISAHYAPDDERSLLDWSLIAGYRGTLVILMGVTHLSKYIQKLISLGKDPATPIAIVENGSTVQEKITGGVLQDFLSNMQLADISSPAIIVIGEVVHFLLSAV